MVDVGLAAGRLVVALLLVALNGFFVGAEFAFVRIRAESVERLLEAGRPGARHLDAAVDRLDDYLAVTQLGITVASLGLGWVGEPAVAALLRPVLEPVLPTGAVHFLAFAVAFGIVTFLHVVFGELAPKTIAIQRTERLALLVASPMRGFYYLFWPGIVVFNGAANAFTRLLGIEPAAETEETLTEEEIRTVLAHAGSEGHVADEEVEMIEQVFELDDTTVRQVMVPRPDVATVSADTPLSALRSAFVDVEHTRLPVLAGDDEEEVVGFVDAKDVLRAAEMGDETVTAGDLARDVIVVPESGSVDEVLESFQSDDRQMAAVIDEWGGFEGIVTVEDVVEEIVGDLRDDFDVADAEPSIQSRPDGSYVVDGDVTVGAINDALDADFERGTFETIGGLVLDRLGRAPAGGDAVAVGDYRLAVASVDGNRIDRIDVEPIDDEPVGDE